MWCIMLTVVTSEAVPLFALLSDILLHVRIFHLLLPACLDLL